MNTAEIVQYLTFRLADELYAINVAHIREVLTVPKITRVPRMPPWLNGMINLRGNVIPVLDLRQKFGLGATPITGDTSIIVTEISDVFADDAAESLILGIFSDSVEKVVDIDAGDIEEPPRIGMSIDTSFISGMGKIGDGFVIMLRLDRILSEADLNNGLAEGVDTAAPGAVKLAEKSRVAEGAEA